MNTRFISKFMRTGHRRTAIAALLGVTGLVCGRAADAQAIAGSTFSLDAIGYNGAEPLDYVSLFTQPVTATFGAEQTFPAAGLDGQPVTVISSESTFQGATTDNVFVYVPSNFVPVGQTDAAGAVIDAVEFSIGDYLGGTQTLDFSTPPQDAVSTGGITFHLAGVALPEGLTQNQTFSNGGYSYSDYEQVTADATSTPITEYSITAFSFAVTYDAVPEPSTNAMMLLGAGGLLCMVWRRRPACA